MIVCHIRTSSGPRWSYHDTNEQLRKELIEYINEVHCDGSIEYGPDVSLENIIEAIEEFEEVSIDNQALTLHG